MNPSPEQIAKLPKWAREHVRVLEMRLQEATDAINPDRTGTRVIANPFGSAATRRFEESDAVVRFMIGPDPNPDGDDWSQYVDACIIEASPTHPRHLRIRSGSAAVLVRPESSNSVSVELAGR